ncbi:MAG: hypothetical protein KatS3mg068_1741 [Candidatus Sericytochromatia bacterium]|nr:MAG: hypothetical protein KatS3mg068_1741 [Candidatus Sericytochromatia bacterium]
MKKKLLLIVSIILFSCPSYAQKNKGVVKAFGDAVTNSVKTGVSKNVKSGFYGKSSLDSLKEDSPKIYKAPEPINTEEIKTNMSLDMNLVKKNQQRENYIINGLFYMRKELYDKALSEFNKAKNIYNSKFIEKWIDIASLKLETIKINKLIDELKSEIDTLKAITSDKK